MNFSSLAGTIAVVVTLLNASGYGDLVWKGPAFAHRHVLAETRRPWRCPSIWNKNACSQYDSKNYR